MFLGERVRRNELTGETISFNGPEHALIIGPTRSGKSRRLLVPNLIMDTARSALVIDIKGELHDWTAAHRRAKGHQIITIDPFEVTGQSSGFNPLARLDTKSDDFVDDATSIAEAIVQISGGDQAHWSNAAQDLITGLIMAECCAATIRKDGSAAALRNVRSAVTKPTEQLAAIAAKAVAEVEARGWNAAIANKLAAYKEITDESKEMQSIVSTARTQTRFLDSVQVVRDLEKGGFDFSVMKTQPTTVYLILEPKRLHMHAKWLRLVIDAAIRDMQQKPRRRGEREALFILDEFPQLGTMRSIEISMSLNAGYGIKVVAAIQHLGQLKELYKENWETFLSGGLITTFAPRDVMTSEHLSRLAGQEWVSVEGTSRADMGATSTSINKQLHPAVLPHEFRRMPHGEMIAFIPDAKAGQMMRRVRTYDATELPDTMIPAAVKAAMR